MLLAKREDRLASTTPRDNKSHNDSVNVTHPDEGA